MLLETRALTQVTNGGIRQSVKLTRRLPFAFASVIAVLTFVLAGCGPNSSSSPSAPGRAGGPPSPPGVATNNWTQESPTASPPARASASMAYDAASSSIVLFGGHGTGTSVLGDTWKWNGTTWIPQSPANSPSPRIAASMAFDVNTGTVLLFGGIAGSNPGASVLGDTWRWNGTTNNWTQMSPGTSPSARWRASMVSDDSTGPLLFGGHDGNINTLGDTWTWNGTTWAQHTGAGPSPRLNASMGYATATDSILLFGGRVHASLGDTWIWNGTTWTQQSPVTSPPVREGASMAFDNNQGNILFGGHAAGINFLGDTWSWDGTTWIQPSPNISPPDRAFASMANHFAADSIVLFGGSIDVVPFSDTWSWH